jgi:hypothetical protein
MTTPAFPYDLNAAGTSKSHDFNDFASVTDPAVTILFAAASNGACGMDCEVFMLATIRERS